MRHRQVPTSKPQMSRRAKDKTRRYPHDIQSDQLHRAAVLGPPGTPQGGRSPEQKDDQLMKLQQRLEQLAVMLDMLKSQNADLQSRVQYLEGCECVRQRCVWEGRDVEDGQRWQTDLHTVCTCTSGKVKCQANIKGCDFNGTHNDLHGCQTCTCKGGIKECHPLSCPSLDCTLKESVPGDCCQRCKGCVHFGVHYEHGTKWRSTENPCDVCSCVEGRARCEREPCSTPCSNPAAPPPNSCCPVCQGCGANGDNYPNGARVPAGDLCQDCTCVNGNVLCSAHPCPSLPCQNPVRRPGDCCPRCEQCEYESKLYVDGQKFSSRTEPCLHCRCSGGSVICQEEKCPPIKCTNPIIDPHACCPTCKACVLDGLEYEEGSKWHPEGPCIICTCINGTPQCSPTCLPTDCSHPTKAPGSCCASCESCTYNHRIYSNGQRFSTPDQPCQVCACQYGSVVCDRSPCPPLNCSNSYTPPGQCCPKCPDCVFENRVFVDGEAFPNPFNACEDCKCVSGSTECQQTQCPRPHCNAPLSGLCCQNNCNGCNYAGKVYPNGQDFPHPTDSCRTCSCINGNVQCLMKRCPQLACTNPSLLPGDCCPRCPGNNYKTYRHSQRFYHPSDSCQSCACTDGAVRCQRKPCPFAACSHPILQECCRTCEGCLHEGRERANGEMWDDSSDTCVACICREGSVRCDRKRCPPSNCKHPVQRQCCMSCEGCMYQGKEYADGTEFADGNDPCGVCYCYGGDVVCTRIPCYGDCSHPYKPPGQCCGECCFYNGAILTNGQSFPDPGNLCSDCTCQCFGSNLSLQAGEVKCASPDCPKLPCMHQVTDPGACCPRCRGCMYGGQNHEEGSSWFAGSTPCISCMCVDGVTTCSEIRCLSPCINFINVPGECCPVCADCVFEGSVYGPGDSFHPAGDPCQICTCEVLPNGEQHLRCYRKQCPSLVDCPKSNILFSAPDSCCPICAQPLSNCTTALIGNEISATNDPCFTCHCKDLTWTCLHQNCPQLTCPQIEQSTPTDSCCPVCKDSSVSCLYQGTMYNSNEQWDVDVCTSCTCVSGDVHCQNQRCPLLTCATDEMPALVPGLCCPHCLPRPATCIAFGDPHYRTFDGRMLHFQGACTYILVQDCEGGDFSIQVTNDDRGRKGVSWTKEVTVSIGVITVQLLQDWVVKVNDETVSLPLLREPHIYIERQSNTILLNTNIGLKVMWSGRSHLEVSVPGTYKGNTCGLCGNFNNYYQDDLRMPSGQISLSEADFGNSWKVKNGSRSLSSCRAGEDIDPCKHAGYQAKKGANARCKVLKSAAFKPCHRVVPPESWYGACVYDLCACGANTDECLCDTLEAYASQCREAGVILHWRSTSLCAVGCPVERGFVFDECGPPCPVTCFNVDVPLGVLESHCFKPCVPGCQCPAGLVLHNNYCIRPEKCPKIIHGDAS
eukprot:XP_011605281.1 PREDICTED: kielin/chordin-like protein [Takifugu rubripes]